MRIFEMMRICAQLSMVMVACVIAGGSMWAADDDDKKKAAQGKRSAQKAKAAKAAEAQFKKMDKDGDGGLSLDEFKATRRRTKSETVEASYKLLDKNKDGQVCIEEFKNKSPEFRFLTMDKDGDGVLTFDEFKGRRKTPEAIEQAEQMFKKMDTNGDVKVCKEEFSAALKKRGAANKKSKARGKGKRGKKKEG